MNFGIFQLTKMELFLQCSNTILSRKIPILNQGIFLDGKVVNLIYIILATFVLVQSGMYGFEFCLLDMVH